MFEEYWSAACRLSFQQAFRNPSPTEAFNGAPSSESTTFSRSPLAERVTGPHRPLPDELHSPRRRGVGRAHRTCGVGRDPVHGGFDASVGQALPEPRQIRRVPVTGQADRLAVGHRERGVQQGAVVAGGLRGVDTLGRPRGAHRHSRPRRGRSVSPRPSRRRRAATRGRRPRPGDGLIRAVAHPPAGC